MKNSTNHFRRVLGALLLCAGVMFASCDKGSLDDEGLAGQNGSGVYLGVIGFNQQLYPYDISKLNDVTTRACEGFIDKLAMKNGTILYYSVDQAINMMQKEARKFTNPLSTAAIVTFTDGLDQGSIMMGGSSFDNNTDYLNYLNRRIKNETVAGSRITAYSIGVPGRDVADVESFRNNLSKLASSEDKAIEVSNMDEVNSEFKEIASQLSSSAVLQTINLTIPGVSDGTKIRFTFDKASSANSSSVYIEGTYNFSSRSLSNVKYVGVSSTSGSVVYGKQEAGSIFVKFSFEGFQTDSGMTISSQNIDEWLYVPASQIWQINSEFDKNENTEIVIEQSSALIMLVLDCSSSLAADFVKAQKNAKDFVKTLQGASSGKMPNIILTPSSGSHDYEGGTYSFRYAISGKNASSQSVSATENESWISNVKNDGGSISYTLSENNSGSSRSGKITVRCADSSVDYVVNQSYTASSITVSPSTCSVDYAGGTFEFTYSISDPREGQSLSAKSESDWITDVAVSGNKVTYKVVENNSGSSRRGFVALTYAGVTQQFVVNQSYTASSITVSPSTCSVDYAGGTFEFTYSISDPREGQSLTAMSDAYWISNVAVSGDKVSYRVAVNSNDSERTGTIILSYGNVSKTVSIYQGTKQVDLSTSATANCYIVSETGNYKFKVVKGNSSQSVGSVVTASVLWESFGTSVTPSVGSLIKSASYNDGYITFQTADTFKEGNAVVAAKDASGNILWSWHIWLTDQPQGQVYKNNAGTMMDRNLGATSATPGDVGALGLLYQWGRKDPFLGSSSISSSTTAKSTISWPSPVSSSSSRGTVSYVTANPTTFVYGTSSTDYDWHYSSRDNTLWTTSDKTKSIYDPCPAGWRVPDGGSSGVWSTALGSSSSYTGTYNSTNEGMNFSSKFGSASTIWYPASGFRDYDDGGLSNVGYSGHYWSASPDSLYAYYLYFYDPGNVDPSTYNYRSRGYSVRCLQESK